MASKKTTVELSTTLLKSCQVDGLGNQYSEQALIDFCESLNSDKSPMPNIKHAECVRVGDHLELRVRAVVDLTYEVAP